MMKIFNHLLNYAALQHIYVLLFSFDHNALHDHNNYTTIDTIISSYLNIKLNILIFPKDGLGSRP